MRALKNLVKFVCRKRGLATSMFERQAALGASLEVARAKTKNFLNFSASQFLRRFLSKKRPRGAKCRNTTI